MIKNKENIYIYYDYEFENIVIRLDENERYIKTFKDINLDVTVVQILPKDNINEIYFLSPDLDYSDKNQLNGKQIYIPQYASGAELKNAKGIIKSIKEDEFFHLVSTEDGSSGSPIFLKDSLKVIGIHKRRDPDKEENVGDFISPIFNRIKNDFFKKNYLDGCHHLDVFFEKNNYFNWKAKRRITKDINEINNSEDKLFKVWFLLDKCFSSIKGPIDSPYEGGLFILNINFPYNYPFRPPEIKFITKIYHPNVNYGNICSDVVKKIINGWTPTDKLIKVLSFIYELIKTPLCETDLCNYTNIEALDLYFKNRSQFELKAKEWTENFAH